MTVSDLYRMIDEGGMATLGMIAAAPVAIGALALFAKLAKQERLSQGLCNFGIAVSFTAFVVEVLALIFVVQHMHVDILGDVDLLQMLLPPVLVTEAVIIEHLLHPSKQTSIRKKMRSGLLILVILGVLYYILGKLNMHMIIWSGMLGFLLFLALIIGAIYYAIRRVV